MQNSFFAPKSEWVPPEELPDLSHATRIAVDVETRDPDLKTHGPGWPTGNGEVVGYAIAVDGWSGYIPIRHRGGGNLDEKIVNRWLKKVFESTAEKVMHNAQYDAGWIRRMGFKLNGRLIDTMILAAILDENRFSYSLNALAYDYLSETKSQKVLEEAAREFGIDPKAELWKMPAMYVGPYAEADAELALKLYNTFSAELTKEELWPIANLELDLLPCLIEMTWRGVRVDLDKVEVTRNNLIKREARVHEQIKDIAGGDVEIWAAQSIAKAFDRLGLHYPKTEKGAPSFTKLFLQESEHALAKLIVEARNLNKTSGTFLNTIMKHAHSDGRIHAHINQLRSDAGGTVSGRLSYNSPNLQQIPARDPEIGPMIRSLFLPEEGEQWASIDFSQQEPRILVHYAHVYGKGRRLELEGAAEFVKAYNEDPATDFHSMVAEMANIPRKQAKTCIAENELVLTDKGLVPIQDVTVDSLVWDGVEWVRHEGVVYRGVKEVLYHDGLWATADHEVWVGPDRTLPFGVAASRLETLVRAGDGEHPLRVLDHCFERHSPSWKAHLRESALRLWDSGREFAGQLASKSFYAVSEVFRVFAPQKAWSHGVQGSVRHVSPAPRGGYFPEVSGLFPPETPKLRRPGDSGKVQGQARAFSIPEVASPCEGVGRVSNRSYRQQRPLRGWKHPEGFSEGEYFEPQKHRLADIQRAEGGETPRLAFSEDGLSGLRLWPGSCSKLAEQRGSSGRNPEPQARRLAKVYDIKNSGPRHRFTVSDRLVHNCGLGLLYGMGVGRLAEELDLPVDEARQLRDHFNNRVPFLKGLTNGVMNHLNSKRSQGALRSLLGRKLRFDLWEPATFGMNKALPYKDAIDAYGATTALKRAYTYKALNRLIQASAADMTKKAMVDIYHSGHVPMLQVHDELAMSVTGPEQAREFANIMEQAVPLQVPNKCDVEIGPSWGEAK